MNNVDLVPGQTILVELEEECFSGEILHVGSGRSFIRLAHVRNIATNKTLGTQTYYNSEIRNIQIISVVKELAKSGASVVDDETSFGNSIKTKQLSLGLLNEVTEQINRYVFVHQTDVKYHDSIRYLKKQRYFGMAMECIEAGRHSKSPSLLSIATFEAIYIFDIKWIKITDDLRELLTSDRYRRVIYNGRVLRDVLKHKFDIILGHSFDVMVAHIAIRKKQQPDIQQISLQSCVEDYLKLPEKFFKSDVNFHLRPLNDEAKRESSKKVVFLLPLQDLFVHEIMLEPFYRNCDEYSQTLARNPDFINSLADLRNNGDEAMKAVEPITLGINLEPLHVSKEMIINNS